MGTKDGSQMAMPRVEHRHYGDISIRSPFFKAPSRLSEAVTLAMFSQRQFKYCNFSLACTEQGSSRN
jgi:hypothetical protein